MAHAEALVADVESIGLAQLDQAQLLQVAEGPDVVVALEEIQFYARIHQVGEGAQRAGIAPGNHVTVFVPEVKNIPQQVQGQCFGRVDSLEELDECAFPALRVSRRGAQMGIGDKVGEVFRHAIRI